MCWPTTLRRVAAVVGMVAVGALPGCTTFALWGRHFPDGSPRTVKLGRSTSLVATEVAQHPGTLHAFEHRDLRGFEMRSDDGQHAWVLRPTADAEIAHRLFRDREMAPAATARLAGTREVLGNELIGAEVVLEIDAEATPASVGAVIDPATLGAAARAVLEIDAEATPASVGAVIDPATLGAAARAVLAEPRRNAVVYAGEPWLFLPVVLRRCMQRLTTGELAAWFGDAEAPVVVTSFVFVGDDGVPRYEPGMPVPAGADDPDLTVEAQLELLAEVALVLRIDRGDREQYVRLRPDRLWAWGACQHTGGRLVHRSRWQLQPVAAGGVDATAREPALAAAFELTTERHERVRVGPPEVSWLRVLLTPVTVLVDCTVGLPLNCVALFADDSDEVPVTPRERR